MICSEIFRHAVYELRIAVGLKMTFLKILVIVTVIHRKSIKNLSLFFQLSTGYRGNQTGIKSSGQKCAYRNI